MQHYQNFSINTFHNRGGMEHGFEGVTEQNKIQQTYDHDCITLIFWNVICIEWVKFVLLSTISKLKDEN